MNAVPIVQTSGDWDLRTPTRPASGWASGLNAVRDAVTTAIDGLDGATPGLVLLFPDAGLPWSEIARQAAAAVPPGSRMAGMTSEGLITAEGVGVRGCTAMAFASATRVGVGLARGASDDMREAGRAGAEAALRDLDPRRGHAAMLLFIDPLSGDEGAVIDGAYAVAGARMPLAGGGANGLTPAVLADGEVCGDAVVAVALCSPSPVAVDIGDGCQPCGGPAIATRTDGRVLLELNGLPAERVYLEGLGCAGVVLEDDAFERFAVVHPLAQPELGGQLRLRHVIGRAPGGGLRCATRIPP